MFMSGEQQTVLGTHAAEVVLASLGFFEFLSVDCFSSAQTEVEEIVVVGSAAEPIRLEVGDVC